MKSPDDIRATKRRADLTLIALFGVGLAVWAFVSVLTGSILLGAVYGVLPGAALGVLGRARILREAGLTRERTRDNEDRGRA